MVSTLMFLFFAFFAVISQPTTPQPTKITPRLELWNYLGLGGVSLIALIMLSQIFNIWRADYLFTQGSRLVDSGNLSQGGPLIQAAIELRPSEDLFYDKFATTLSQAAYLFLDQEAKPEAQSAAQSALMMNNRALELNPVNVNLHKSRVRLLMALSALDPQLLTDAQEAALEGLKLAPTDAKLVYNLGVISHALGDTETALTQLHRALEMKDNYIQVREYLADYYLQNDQLDLARAQLEKILADFPDNEAAQEKMATLEAQPRYNTNR
jgi:tetratricopeptide (TPR) repeat protein